MILFTYRIKIKFPITKSNSHTAHETPQDLIECDFHFENQKRCILLNSHNDIISIALDLASVLTKINMI